MSEELSNRLENVVKNAMTTNLAEDRTNWPYQSIEDYRAKTGKRFRMTRAQTASGVTREQAFVEFVQNLMSK